MNGSFQVHLDTEKEKRLVCLTAFLFLAMRDGNLDESCFVDLHQFFAFNDQGRLRQERWQIEIDRKDKSQLELQQQIMGLFKLEKTNFTRVVDVTFKNEFAVGSGLLGSWVKILSDDIIAPRFEGTGGGGVYFVLHFLYARTFITGESDHLLPKKSFDVVCDWKTIGRIMGHIIRQRKVVMVGLSPVVKDVICGKQFSDTSIVTADLPDAILRTAISKVSS